MKRDSFIFYRSFFEATIPLNDNDKLDLFNTICEFALNQTETETEPMVKAMFTLIKPQLEANHKKYEQIIDDAADEISNFIEKAKLENISQ